MTPKKRILITFARSFLTLELARQFKAHGHTIIVADSLHAPLSSFSNAVEKVFRTPSPRFHPTEYTQALIDIVVKEKIDLLVPIYEEITYISKGAHLFPTSCEIFCPSFSLYEQLQNKWLFQQKLQELDIPTLKYFLVKDEKDLLQQPLKEYALKPCHSRASQFVYKISPSSPPPALCYEPHNPWIAQEWATGKKFCTYSVCYQGTVNAHSAYPVSYAIDGNSCIIYESINHPKIHQWISNFVKKINFTGQIAFDFIEPAENKLYAIECNPRATSGLLLFRPQDRLDRAFFNTLEEPILPPTTRRQQVAMGMLMYGWRKSAKKNNKLSDYLKTLFTTKDVIFRLNDLKPFLLEPLIFGKLWFKSKKLGLSIPDFYTYDHDWNGEKAEG